MIKLNIVNGSLVEIPFNENLPTIEVSEEEHEKIKFGQLRFVEGKLVDMTRKNEIRKRIDELKRLLDDSDYKSIQHSEGVLPDEEFAPIKAQREAWRDGIRQLQKEL